MKEPPSTNRRPLRPDPTSIAVLPFENMSEDPDDQYVGDGIAEEITKSLSEIPGLRVAAQASAFSFRGSGQSLASIAEKLGVGALMEGKVRKEGSRIQVSVRILDPWSGGTLWSDEQDLEQAHLVDVRNEITKSAARYLKPGLAQETASRRPSSERPEAHDLYLRGRFVMGHRGEVNMRKALEYFERAVTVDPQFSSAHIGISQILGLLSLYGFARAHDAMPRARAAAERALSLDETLAEAHAARAFVLLTYDWDWEGAERAYLRSLRQNPNDPSALVYYAFYYLICLRSRLDEGMELIWRAVDIDPIAPVPMAMLGVASLWADRPANVVPRVVQAVEGQPSSWLLQRSLGMALAAEGRHSEAVAALERAARLSHRYSWTLMDLGTTHAELGNQEAARRIHRELEDMAKERYLQPMALAAIPAALGEADEALPALRKAFEERDSILIVIRRYPPFRGLRRETAFTSILAAMGL